MSGIQVSTLIMTGLLGIGLFFFIRAGSKDRTEYRRYHVTGIPMDSLGSQLQRYTQTHGFTLSHQDEQGRALFVGTAQPSAFLAVFLSVLALMGISCGVIVIRTLFPSLGGIPWLLLAAAPWAGTIYRQRMQRQESLSLWLAETDQGSRLEVQGQRDELDRLERFLGSFLGSFLELENFG